MNQAQCLDIRILGERLVAALVVIDYKLSILLHCLWLVRQWAAFLLRDKALQNRLW